MRFINRTGEINISNEGYEMKIVKYNSATDILVEFQDEYKTKVSTTYGNFQKGNIKNPYHLSVFGFGYIGQGKYKASIKGKATKAYECWKDMLQRCYDPYHINKEPTYIDCYVCDEWLCFQKFAEWFYKNYYECNNERMHLDKDILHKGNKIYSPETCVFVPQRINGLFIKCDKSRGKYLIGVCWDKKVNKFKTQCGILDENGKQKLKYLGYYDNELDAFLTYKQFKMNYIKQIADEYKELIPIELYKALCEYKIEIND